MSGHINRAATVGPRPKKPAPSGDVGTEVAAVRDALWHSRLFFGTHSDRWTDREWQCWFWTEAAEIATTALASIIAEREREAVRRWIQDAPADVLGGIIEAAKAEALREAADWMGGKDWAREFVRRGGTIHAIRTMVRDRAATLESLSTNPKEN